METRPKNLLQNKRLQTKRLQTKRLQPKDFKPKDFKPKDFKTKDQRANPGWNNSFDEQGRTWKIEESYADKELFN